MRKRVAFLIVEAILVLAAIAWFASHSTKQAQVPLELAAPPAEKLAALDSAETSASPAIESPAGPAREALEVRKLQTRAATIQVLPPVLESENRGLIRVWCYAEGSRANVTPDEVTLVAPDGHELHQRPAKDGDTFCGLTSDRYTVIVSDSRFADVRVDSVPTGSHVMIDLVGTARVRPHALDADTGEAIAASSLRLLDFGHEKELAPDAEGWFSGLPGGDMKLRVATPGYAATVLEIPGLAAGESREVELRFSRAGEIRGIVVGEDDGQPIANVTVSLEWLDRRGALLELMNRNDVAARNQLIGSRPQFSDALGRFSFKDLPFGDFSVQARQGGQPGSSPQSVKLAPGTRVEEVVLRVPRGCSLVGTLTCNSTGDQPPRLDELFVSIHSPGEAGGRPGNTASTNVRSDGSFQMLDSLPIGRAEVRLQLGYARLGRLLGELDLHSGLNECSFDISEFLPGGVEVEIVAPGVAIDGGELLIAPLQGGLQVENFEFAGSSALAGPLPAGDYLLLARGNLQGWMSSTPVPLRIDSNRSSRVRLELRLVPGRLVVRDAEGGPMGPPASALISRSIPGWPGGEVLLRSELADSGELALALEPGPFSLRLVGFAGRAASFASGVAFEWTATGPSPAVLHLPSIPKLR